MERVARVAGGLERIRIRAQLSVATRIGIMCRLFAVEFSAVSPDRLPGGTMGHGIRADVVSCWAGPERRSLEIEAGAGFANSRGYVRCARRTVAPWRRTPGDTAERAAGEGRAGRLGRQRRGIAERPWSTNPAFV